ncbi:hypothetical protein BGX24_008383 [Mortierella sp. AD032]|nr:hypothetical protein BGX24_008383 [Mortierella sp. AD032]
MRNELLIQLKRLTLPSMCTTNMSRIYYNILRQYPSLETLEMPCISVLSDEANRAIASIDHEYELIDFDLDKTLCISSADRASSHSTRIESLVVKTALTTCCALKVFKAIGSGIQSDVGLLLSHAIEHAWVCKELRELEIDISITAVGNNAMYLIGSLTYLEVLCLNAARPIRNPSEYHGLAATSADACLSGLLALEDLGAGQIGYLSKLAGLTKLRELRGSFVWTNEETQARIGDQEVDWFVNHLPALRMATFMDVMFRFRRDPSQFNEYVCVCKTSFSSYNSLENHVLRHKRGNYSQTLCRFISDQATEVARTKVVCEEGEEPINYFPASADVPHRDEQVEKPYQPDNSDGDVDKEPDGSDEGIDKEPDNNDEKSDYNRFLRSMIVLSMQPSRH